MATLTQSPNLNYLWAKLIVEELVRQGVVHFCISPGSRSSALTVAVAQNKKVKSHIHFDERGNAFRALGLTSYAKEPCAIITTSGTAIANLFPAIIEASKKKLPLIVLTADRPPELRFTGAHQTIDQVKIFGDYVRFFIDLPTPTSNIKPEYVLTTVDQAVQKSKGELPGPVHINCMFREPLAPTKTGKSLAKYCESIKRWESSKSVYTDYIKPQQLFDTSTLKEAASVINKTKNGIIVAGKVSKSDGEAILKLAEKIHWPVFPDITSTLRFKNHPLVINYFDQLLLSKKLSRLITPDTILHFGGRITSKRWYEFIEKSQPRHMIMVLNHPLRNDPLHNVTLRVQSKAKIFVNSILKSIKAGKQKPSLNKLKNANERIHSLLSEDAQKKRSLSEYQAARIITASIGPNKTLFLSSSLPVRLVDMFGTISDADITIGSNRGASGIDGTVASAAGFSHSSNKQTTLLIGDLALLYDINSLGMLNELNKPVTIVCLNNNGGGIFSHLPIADYKQVFEKYFGTPHNLHFKHAAEMFDLNYHQPQSCQEFQQTYQKSLKAKKSTLIEINTNRAKNYKEIKDIQLKIKNSINKLT